MRTWYIYRSRRRPSSVRPFGGINNLSFSFRKDRKTFNIQNCDILWQDTSSIRHEQLMIEAELTRKYKV